MIAEPYDVVGVGYCAVDYLGIVPTYPGLDEKVRLTEFARQGGGLIATAMATVGRLGGRASYIGKIGGDEFGRFTIEELDSDHVDTKHVVVDPSGVSQFAFIAVDQETGKRTIFWTPSGVMLEPEEIRREDVLAGKVLQVDGHYPRAALQAATWANEAGIPVVMDAGTMREGSIEIAEKTDALITSALYARQFTGQDDPETAARVMFNERRLVSAVTLGDQGCVYVTSDGAFHQPAFTVDVVDTTGAGDVFHGAFSFGLAKGWPVPQVMEFAAAVAAIKCTKLGGRAGIPTLPQVIAFLRANGTKHQY
jgi:sulfofructose kinase